MSWTCTFTFNQSISFYKSIHTFTSVQHVNTFILWILLPPLLYREGKIKRSEVPVPAEDTKSPLRLVRRKRCGLVHLNCTSSDVTVLEESAVAKLRRQELCRKNASHGRRPFLSQEINTESVCCSLASSHACRQFLEQGHWPWVSASRESALSHVGVCVYIKGVKVNVLLTH